MSAVPTDIAFYCALNSPDTDGVTAGGGINFACRPMFSDLLGTGTIDYVSSSASDTACTIAMTVLDASGVLQTENKTFTGTTPVVGAQQAERLMKGVIGGTAAVGDLAAISHTPVISAHTAQAGSAQHSGNTPALFKLQAGDGANVALFQVVRITGGTGAGQLRYIAAVSGYGTDVVAVNRDWTTIPDATSTYNIHTGMLFDLAPNQVTQVRRPFFNASADAAGGSVRVGYEKIFAVNTNGATTITLASIIKQVDPSAGTLDFALCNNLNDTSTISSRGFSVAPGAAPSGITAYSSGAAPQSIAVPSPQNLPFGNAAAGAQGIWLRETLAAGAAAAKTAATMRGTGTSV